MSAPQDDDAWMRRALTLAKKSRGDVRHYPMVGAVIVKAGKLVAEGVFREPGEPHAEVHALRKAGNKARGATAYVNLEPCSHFGTTPPCADALIAAGVKRVVGGMTDPNPLVAGNGFRKLRAAGIEVTAGVLERECKELNRVFVKFITTGRPYVFMKAAATLDGKIAAASGDAFWISGEPARREGHRLRAFCQAVMVGAGTVRTDDPELTVRMIKKGRHPRPVIVSSNLDLPLVAKVMTTPAEGGPLIFATRAAAAKKVKAFRDAGAEVVLVKKNRQAGADLSAVMGELGKRKIASVLLEGGSSLHGSALMAGVVDELMLVPAPKLLGGDGVSITSGKGMKRIAEAIPIADMSWRKVGDDLMIVGKVAKQ